MQVHKLDAEKWKKTEVVYIDIADRSQVESKVSKLECLYCLYRKRLIFSILLLSITPSSPFISFKIIAGQVVKTSYAITIQSVYTDLLKHQIY